MLLACCKLPERGDGVLFHLPRVVPYQQLETAESFMLHERRVCMTTARNRELRQRQGKAYCDPDIRFSTVCLAVFHFALDCCATYAVTDLQYKAKPRSQTAAFIFFLCRWKKTKFTHARERATHNFKLTRRFS
jgi:hypothetical protein